MVLVETINTRTEGQLESDGQVIIPYPYSYPYLL